MCILWSQYLRRTVGGDRTLGVGVGAGNGVLVLFQSSLFLGWEAVQWQSAYLAHRRPWVQTSALPAKIKPHRKSLERLTSEPSLRSSCPSIWPLKAGYTTHTCSLKSTAYNITHFQAL